MKRSKINHTCVPAGDVEAEIIEAEMDHSIKSSADRRAEMDHFIKEFSTPITVRDFLDECLDKLSDELDSSDEEVRQKAMEQISEILKWTLPPAPRKPEERIGKALEFLTGNLHPEVKVASAIHALQPPLKPTKGRQRDDSNSKAIEILQLRMDDEEITWSEVVRRYCNCPKKAASGCDENCTSKFREKVRHLKVLLTKLGFYSD